VGLDNIEIKGLCLDSETAWNAFRLSSFAAKGGTEQTFLLEKELKRRAWIRNSLA